MEVDGESLKEGDPAAEIVEAPRISSSQLPKKTLLKLSLMLFFIFLFLKRLNGANLGMKRYTRTSS